jgi:hypothetical protein
MTKLQPTEAALIHRIYEGIIQESWFNRNAVTERELLKLVLTSYRQALEEAALSKFCEAEAKKRFSRR